MQCAEFEDRLNRLLDHRLSPDDDGPLGEHAEHCELCADLLHAQQRLFIGLHLSRPIAPVDLAERVMSRQHSQVQTRRALWRGVGWSVLLASAASLAGLAMLSLAERAEPENVAKQPAAPTGKQQPTGGNGGLAIAAVKPAPATEATEEQLDEVFDAVEDFATRLSDRKQLEEVGESLSPGIRPIRSSFGLAIDALWRTLPRGKDAPEQRPDAGAQLLLDFDAIG